MRDMQRRDESPLLGINRIPFSETNRRSYRMKEPLLPHYPSDMLSAGHLVTSYITSKTSNPLHYLEYRPESVHVCILTIDTALVTILSDSSPTRFVRIIEPDFLE